MDGGGWESERPTSLNVFDLGIHHSTAAVSSRGLESGRHAYPSSENSAKQMGDVGRDPKFRTGLNSPITFLS
jgi:hypothetical protein